ncbi:MAG: nucleoside triphosphate pyrophosphatase [Jatrophihabitantaceae bacterium]
MRFVLASASPARLRTLRAAGVAPEVIVSQVDEDAIAATMTDASTAELVQQLAIAKAQAVRPTLTGDALVLGCDSILDFGGRALGKPGTVAAATERWREMRGGRGTLYTGHCLIDTGSGRVTLGTSATEVHFADLTDDEIELYCGTGEPSNVAGAFTIDGLGGWFVSAVEGDHHNVVGVSLPDVRRMLGELGYSLADIGYPTP